MPPARPRVLEDARSETSLTNIKDRVASTSGASKSRKAANVTSNGVAPSSSKAANTSTNNNAATTAATRPSDTHSDPPHVDWSALSVHALHNYRSAYRLQIPASYTQPHAELLYRSCDLALRAPSQVLARRKAHDLKLYRKAQAQQTTNSRVATNGVSKPSKTSRVRDKESSTKRKGRDVETNTSANSAPPIEEPPSPTSHPSQIDSASNPSRKSPTVSSSHEQQGQEDEKTHRIPVTLNQNTPEETVIGSLPTSSLATSIRTHFNAQQTNEAETIARFTYVVRQQGSNIVPRVQPLPQRLGILPLPTTTAENIANVANNASNATASRLVPALAPPPAPNTTSAIQEKGKGNVYSGHSISAPRLLAGNHIEVEGSYGDGHGWIMGTTSRGRQVRIQDAGGTGTFRLRFRP